ncbi:hypothetical protein KZ483_25315 [Paenibacillus sp. sptzw28]|uniref:hypothetical protein n=1 Tax=Paenibacillus sp. sptzw28 TaxID=715179 RepID=UPI001C6ED1CF|nr:hypothetical protein [Paenibacillus sp. sptzw28]QYR24407.1 hypothetical protein KZ483_25315 [Paenibacillus sp. sptzw28]
MSQTQRCNWNGEFRTDRQYKGSAVQHSNAVLYSVTGDSKDAYNDIGKEQVRVIEQPLHWNAQSDLTVEIQPHSVNVLVVT